MLLDQVALAADAVDRLQRPVVGHVAQERARTLAFGQVAQPPQRLDDERGVAQPAEAVVPGALGAERLGNAGRRRGDDRAGVDDRRAASGTAPSAAPPRARTTAARSVFAHARQPRDRQLERALDRRRVESTSGGRPALSAKKQRPIDAERRGRRRWYGAGTFECRYRRVRAADAPRGPRPVGDDLDVGARVVGPRIEAHAQRAACPRAAAAAGGSRSARPRSRPCGMRGAKSKTSKRPSAVAISVRSDVGVAHVGHRRRPRPRPARSAQRAAALLVEQPREHRRAVEARQAQPVDAGVGADQRQHAAVADGAVMRGGDAASPQRPSVQAAGRRQQRAGPVEDRVRQHLARAARASAARCSSAGIDQRRVQRVGERVDGERIDQHGVGPAPARRR